MKYLFPLLVFLFIIACSSSDKDPRVTELFDKGYQAIQSKDYAQAALYLSELISIDSTYLEARNNYAVALWNMGKPELAWDQVNYIFKVAPDFRDALINTYAWALEIEDYQKAFKTAERLSISNPDTVRFISWRAQAALQGNMIERALDDYNHLVKLDLKNYTHWVNRSLVFIKLGDFESSEADLKEALKLKSFEPLIFNNLAMVCLYAGKYLEAGEYSLSALRIDPELADSKIIASLCAILNGQYEKGMEILGDTIQYPDDIKPYVHRNLTAYYILNKDFTLAARYGLSLPLGKIYPEFAGYFAAKIVLEDKNYNKACEFLSVSMSKHEWDSRALFDNYCKP